MPTLHVVGSSISEHYGPFLQQYLAGRLDYSRKESMPGDPNEPNGANGGDSSLVLRYLRACRERNWRWDVLLLSCGLHDLRRTLPAGAYQVAPDAYARNLHEIIACAGDLAHSVVWVRATPVVDAIHNAHQQAFRRFAADVVAYNTIADAIMQANNTPIIDLFAFTRALGDDVYLDHVHFMESVRQLQAAFIAGHVLAWFGPSRSPQ
jgi:hypothetical protein